MIHTWNSTCSCTLFVTPRDLFFSHHRANWDVTLVLLYTILSAQSEVDLDQLYKYRPRFTKLNFKKGSFDYNQISDHILEKLLAGCENECGRGIAVYLIYATKKLFTLVLSHSEQSSPFHCRVKIWSKGLHFGKFWNIWYNFNLSYVTQIVTKYFKTSQN